MSVERLKAIIPPPENPVYNGHGEDWEAVEAELGIALPFDYRKLIATYGEGDFCDTFGIKGPFSGVRGLISVHASRSDHFRNMLSECDEDFEVFPDEGGLLYFGGDEHMNSLMWLTEGSPDAWPIVMFDDYMQEFDVFRMPLTEFLFRWATEDIYLRLHDGLFGFEKPPLERRPLFRSTPVRK